LQWTQDVLGRLGLRLNHDITVVRDARKEHSDFLGYTFGSVYFRKTGKPYMGPGSSKKSIGRLKQKVGGILRPGEKGAWPEVCARLDALLRRWCTYFFCYGTTQIAYCAVERNVYNRVRLFLVAQHKVSSRGIHRFPSEKVFGEIGFLLPRPMKIAAQRAR
jgi:RNA-directed DNA polymerase